MRTKGRLLSVIASILFTWSFSASLTIAQSDLIPVPSGQNIIQSPPSASATLHHDFTLANPLGLGPIASGGNALDLQVALNGFSAPVDIYVAFYAPAIDPFNVFSFAPDSRPQPISAGFYPWRGNTTGPIDEMIAVNVPRFLLPRGTYNFYVAVTRAGQDVNDTYSMYLWVSSLEITTNTSISDTITLSNPPVTFALIQPGNFMMGSPWNEVSRGHNMYQDEQAHMVSITQPFYMQTTEVTQAQWQAVMGNNPSDFSNCPDCPVENVSWNDVQEFIQRLNQNEGTDKYRLPTEAEWEYAARAGSYTAFANGGSTVIDGSGNDPNLDAMGWYSANSGRSTHPVAQKQANAWGLYDMHGNVFEWCSDWYGAYPYGQVTNPLGPASGSYRVLRGGDWGGSAGSCRSAERFWGWPDLADRYMGFRLARTP